MLSTLQRKRDTSFPPPPAPRVQGNIWDVEQKGKKKEHTRRSSYQMLLAISARKKDMLQTSLIDVSWTYYSHAPNHWPGLFLKKTPVRLSTWCSPGQVPGRIPRSCVITLSSCSSWEVRLGLSTRHPICGEKTHDVGGLCRWQATPWNWSQQFWRRARMTSATVE